MSSICCSSIALRSCASLIVLSRARLSSSSAANFACASLAELAFLLSPALLADNFTTSFGPTSVATDLSCAAPPILPAALCDGASSSTALASATIPANLF